MKRRPCNTPVLCRDGQAQPQSVVGTGPVVTFADGDMLARKYREDLHADLVIEVKLGRQAKSPMWKVERRHPSRHRESLIPVYLLFLQMRRPPLISQYRSIWNRSGWVAQNSAEFVLLVRIVHRRPRRELALHRSQQELPPVIPDHSAESG